MYTPCTSLFVCMAIIGRNLTTSLADNVDPIVVLRRPLVSTPRLTSSTRQSTTIHRHVVTPVVPLGRHLVDNSGYSSTPSDFFIFSPFFVKYSQIDP